MQIGRYRTPVLSRRSWCAQLPRGVSRYGFDPFVAQYPGNTVAAIGAYWISCNQTTNQFMSL